MKEHKKRGARLKAAPLFSLFSRVLLNIVFLYWVELSLVKTNIWDPHPPYTLGNVTCWIWDWYCPHPPGYTRKCGLTQLKLTGTAPTPYTPRNVDLGTGPGRAVATTTATPHMQGAAEPCGQTPRSDNAHPCDRNQRAALLPRS